MTPNRHRSGTGRSIAPLFLRTAAREESGAELLEFAVIAPILLTLMLGIVWMGRAYNVYQTITRAAREGARYAVLPNCATCGNLFPDTYAQGGSCLANPTNTFTDYVAPSVAASSMDPTKITNYCQKADWLENTSPRQCGVIISFAYPVQLQIPFTNLRSSTVDISTQVGMRLENQGVDASGNPTCP